MRNIACVLLVDMKKILKEVPGPHREKGRDEGEVVLVDTNNTGPYTPGLITQLILNLTLKLGMID